MAHFVCSLCGELYPYAEHHQRCSRDGEPLDIQLDPGDGEHRMPGDTLLHQWQQFLPFDNIEPGLDLGAGNTPLVPARRLGERIGVPKLFIKNEGLNPTGSFKDRGTLAGMQRALDLGFSAVGTVSSGNMAGSMAAFAARAGLECFVMVSSRIPPEKLGPIGVYAPHLTLVEGDYGDLYQESLRIGREEGIYFIPGDEPFRVEGQKTLALEICRQLEGQGPDYIFMPLSSGGNMVAVLKGLRQLQERGMLERLPMVVGVQAEGSSPVARAFAQGKERYERIPNPQTICGAITNGSPPSGNRVLRMLEGGKYGRVMAVSDQEALESQAEMARLAGVWGQPDSAVPVAAIKRALAEGWLDSSARVVAVVTGNGLKDQSIFKARPVETRQVALGGLHDLVRSLKGGA